MDPIITPILGSLAGGLMSNMFANDRQSSAQDFSAQQFATRYQTTVKDMSSAGLNPMLAYAQGGGSAPTSSAASASGMPDLGQTYLQAKMNSAQVANIEAQTEKTTADSQLSRALTQKAVADTGLSGAQSDESRGRTSLMETQAKQVVESIKNIPLEGDRLIALAKQLKSSQDLLDKQGVTEGARAAQMKWLALTTMHDSDLRGLDVEAARKFDNFGREYRQYAPIVDLLKSLLRK